MADLIHYNSVLSMGRALVTLNMCTGCHLHTWDRTHGGRQGPISLGVPHTRIFMRNLDGLDKGESGTLVIVCCDSWNT